MKIGVLALQGAVSEHLDMLGRVGAEGTAVKKTEQLADLDGVIIPGGESTTIGKLMRTFGFMEALRQFSAEGKPIFGTCAGAIIIADEIANQEEAHLGLMRMRVARNAFGRQRESFEADLKIKGMDEPFRAVFIRAPIIESVGEGVEVLAEINGQIVAARQGHLLACSFHPELTDDPRLHALFADMVKSSQSTNAAQQLS